MTSERRDCQCPEETSFPMSSMEEVNHTEDQLKVQAVEKLLVRYLLFSPIPNK